MNCLEITSLNVKGIILTRDLRKRMEALPMALPGDIIALQEVFAYRARKALKIFPHHPHIHKPAFRLKPVSSGLATLSRFPFKKRKFLSFRSGSNIDIIANKGVQLTRIEHEKLGTVDFYNTHLQASYNGLHQYHLTRRKQLGQLIGFIQENSPLSHTIILCGDFNFVPYSPGYRFLMESPLKLIDLVQKKHPNTGLPTMRKNNPYVRKGSPNLVHTDAIRLDYILVRPAEEFILDLRNSTIQTITSYEDTILSDHDGLCARIAFKQVGKL